ncbi:hypothetical protein GGS21DRAFT_490207 [Xylaria nigripes]|nr:hypothetical protein GGS21DRAFT_490207 [Xylaria nigripes]
MKLFSLLTLGTAVMAEYHKRQRMMTVAGVEVIDTRILRSWLFGAAMINANETLKNSIDLEVHASGCKTGSGIVSPITTAAMLHDLGWDQMPNSRWVSADKRFEIDGAIDACTWLSEGPIGKTWAPDRVRKVF